MKSKRAALLLALFFMPGADNLGAQMPNFFAPPPTPVPVTQPVSPAVPVAPVGPAKETLPATDQLQPYKDVVYDPAMDNHLKAPSPDNHIGLFGLSVSKVENLLMANGAKKHSYAFGKYSRLTLSVYMVTVYFDRERLVGAFSVEPRAPYKTIEPEARKFFFDLFLKDADLSQFEANIANSRLEVRYKP